jgi:hypothetical protein
MAVAVCLFTAVAAGAIVLIRGWYGHADRATHVSPPSLAARFADVSHAHSNRCGMPASALEAMAPGARLQGSCCFPMDYRSYVNQVHVLERRYADVDVIPKDPYDISVKLAKRLIGYQTIKLTPEQQRIYNRAKPLSETKGPCCCRCWRWTAFGGQAKYLITRRRSSAKQIAEVWSLEEGCGGPSHTSSGRRP